MAYCAFVVSEDILTLVPRRHGLLPSLRFTLVLLHNFSVIRCHNGLRIHDICTLPLQPHDQPTDHMQMVLTLTGGQNSLWTPFDAGKMNPGLSTQTDNTNRKGKRIRSNGWHYTTEHPLATAAKLVVCVAAFQMVFQTSMYNINEIWLYCKKHVHPHSSDCCSSVFILPPDLLNFFILTSTL